MTSHGGDLDAEASIAGSRCRLRGLEAMMDDLEVMIMVQEEARTDVRRS